MGVGGRSKVLISISSDTAARATRDVRPARRAREICSEKYTEIKLRKKFKELKERKKIGRTVLEVSTLRREFIHIFDLFS